MSRSPILACCTTIAVFLSTACGPRELIPRDLIQAHAHVASASSLTSFLYVLDAALPCDDALFVSVLGFPADVMRTEGLWRQRPDTPTTDFSADAPDLPLAEIARVLSALTSSLPAFEVRVTVHRRSYLGAFLFTVRFVDGRVSEVTPLWFST